MHAGHSHTGSSSKNPAVAELLNSLLAVTVLPHSQPVLSCPVPIPAAGLCDISIVPPYSYILRHGIPTLRDIVRFGRALCQSLLKERATV